ncbi:MAG: hypothetical protein HY352_04990 [Candidatus Omnitrophica bacterium]|nr:hypothetical protein [Candidatus Omnitrophota bacterium]
MAEPALAATRVTIRELKEHPQRYYGEELLLECYYDKESPVWVRALPDADEWVGFFVTGRPDKTLTWSGEYYNLLFTPARTREALRTFRGGDKITVIGEGFRYASTSLEGVGIHVRQFLAGWGPSAKSIHGSGNTAPMPAASVAPGAPPSSEVSMSAPPPLEGGEKLAVTINGKHYTGLRFGDAYNFDGIEFQVDKSR